MRSRLRRWARELVILGVLAIAISLAVDYARRPAVADDFISQPLHTLDGRAVDLAAMSQQRPLLIYVWATWCGICRFTTPSVASLAADGGNVVSVALRSGDGAALEQWLRHKRIAFPVVNDSRGELARGWGVQVTPTLIVVSKGRVESVTSGWTSGAGMRLRLWLAS